MAYWRLCVWSSIKQIAVLGYRISSTHLHGMNSVTSSTLSVLRHIKSSKVISPHAHNGASSKLFLLINFEHVHLLPLSLAKKRLESLVFPWKYVTTLLSLLKLILLTWITMDLSPLLVTTPNFLLHSGYTGTRKKCIISWLVHAMDHSKSLMWIQLGRC